MGVPAETVKEPESDNRAEVFDILAVHRQNRRMTLRRLHHQQGIALGPILFIIAVLAVLAAAIAAGSGGFSGSINPDSAKVAASVILQESQQVQSTVQLLMANGCDETQLNFLASAANGNNTSNIGANPSAPTDHHCDLFDPRGGNLIYVPIPSSYCVSGATQCRYFPSDETSYPV